MLIISRLVITVILLAVAALRPTIRAILVTTAAGPPKLRFRMSSLKLMSSAKLYSRLIATAVSLELMRSLLWEIVGQAHFQRLL